MSGDKDRRVILFTEHRARELDVACAIYQRVVERYGVEIEVASLLDDLEALIGDWKPEIVVVPVFTSSWDFRVRELMALCPGATFVNLQYEQLLFDEHKEFKGPKDSISREHVIHLAFGEFFREHLIGHGVMAENIRVVGSVSCALYGAPYREYYASREALGERYGLDVNRKWLFIPENYSAAFLSDQKVQNMIDRGFVAEKAFAYRAFALELFEKTAPWWRAVADKLDVEIVVRPRPATAKVQFEERLIDLVGELPANLKVIKEGTVREWVLGSDVVASSYSTTLIEAASAGKASVMMQPLAMPEFLNADFFDALPCVRTYEEFEGFIEGVGQGEAMAKTRRWIREHLLRHGDPIVNVADVLGGLLCGEIVAPAPPLAGMIENAEGVEPPIDLSVNASHAQRIEVATVEAVGLGRDGVDPWEDDRFSQSEVDETLGQWGRVILGK